MADPPGTRRHHGQFRIPFKDHPVLHVFRDKDGKFYTDFPPLAGPFHRRKEIRCAVKSLLRDQAHRREVEALSLELERRKPDQAVRRRRAPDARPPTPSEKLVAGAFEASAALARQAQYASSSKELLDVTPSEEYIIGSTPTMPRDTIDGSSTTVPFRCEKLVAGAAESASAQTLQEPDLSYLEELLTTTSLEGSVTATPGAVPHNTTGGFPQSASFIGSKILIIRPRRWYQVYFIRMNRLGSFSMYPDLGGPFQSIDEAGGAISRHLDGLRCPELYRKREKMCYSDWVIHEFKYYPDGTPKRGRKDLVKQETFLVQALVDQHNDACNLFGNRAHELERLVRHNLIDEEDRSYYHFNFTTKTKEADDTYSRSGNLFFAEVSREPREDYWEIRCYCRIGPDDNGLCYGCSGYSDDMEGPIGCPGMQHPKNTDAYIGGHDDEPYEPYGETPLPPEDEEAEDARMKAMLECLDEPGALERIYFRANQIKEKCRREIQECRKKRN